MFQGLLWVARKIQERAEEELFDPEPVRAALVASHGRFELGEISEAEFTRTEAALLARLEALELRRHAS